MQFMNADCVTINDDTTRQTCQNKPLKTNINLHK